MKLLGPGRVSADKGLSQFISGELEAAETLRKPGPRNAHKDSSGTPCLIQQPGNS